MCTYMYTHTYSTVHIKKTLHTVVSRHRHLSSTTCNKVYMASGTNETPSWHNDIIKFFWRFLMHTIYTCTYMYIIIQSLHLPSFGTAHLIYYYSLCSNTDVIHTVRDLISHLTQHMSHHPLLTSPQHTPPPLTLLQTAVQLLGNLCVGHPEGQARVWECCFPQLFR